MAVGNILVIFALAFAVLDAVLWYTTTYQRHILLQLSVILICVALIFGVPGLGHA
jgi:hypothetical protein